MGRNGSSAPRQSVGHFPGSVLGVESPEQQGSRRPSRRECHSELAAARGGPRGSGTATLSRSPGTQLGCCRFRDFPLLAPGPHDSLGGVVSLPARSSRPKSPANEAVPQWVPPCVRPRRQRGPKGLRGLSVEKLRGTPRVCAEVTHRSPAHGAARDSAWGSPSSRVAHLRAAVARREDAADCFLPF